MLAKYDIGGHVGYDKQGCPVWIYVNANLDTKGLRIDCLNSAAKVFTRSVMLTENNLYFSPRTCTHKEHNVILNLLSWLCNLICLPLGLYYSVNRRDLIKKYIYKMESFHVDIEKQSKKVRDCDSLYVFGIEAKHARVLVISTRIVD